MPLSRILPLILAFTLAAGHAQADEWNQYRIQGNLFNDYKPAHQRANPGAEWERTKERERARIDREFEQKRSRPYSGHIDNRDYSRRSRHREERMEYHSPDRNRHRHSGSIDYNDYGQTRYRAPSGRTAQQWVGPDYTARNRQTPNTAKRQNTAGYGSRYGSRYGNSYSSPYNKNSGQAASEKYYGTRSGESLYPYTGKPVKGTIAADAAKERNKNSSAIPRATAKAAWDAARVPDPSYGGNSAWKVSKQNRVDTRRYYQDEIARYRKEHRPAAYCKDGTVSGRGGGACSGHGGLLKRG